MKTILMTAYDINPYKGSESGTGWNFVIQASYFNNVIAVTRKNNQHEIEKYIQEFSIKIENIKFYYYDFPYYLRFWKRGAKGSSLYFYLWQMFMPLFIKQKKINFDIAHNVNFHADAFPTFLWVLGKPTVWGPINHNEKIPKEYLDSKKEYLKDRVKWIAKNINWNIDPFMILAKKNVDIIIGGNSSVQRRLGICDKKFICLSQVASHQINLPLQKINSKQFNILIVGRFLTIKSFDLALFSYEAFYNNLPKNEQNNINLTIIGQGFLEKKLINIQKNFNSKNSIEFIGWVEKERMDEFYQKANLFLFPSHEGAGMVVAEAMSYGLPVVCFDNYGPGELVSNSCAIKIQYSTYQQSISDFSDALKKLYFNKELYQNMSKKAIVFFDKKYIWSRKGKILKDIYNSLKEVKR